MKKRVAVKRVQKRRLPVKSEYASMSQTLSLVNDPMNTIYRVDNINLSRFDRAVQVARAYQYFRITNVEFQFKPFMDTYTDSSVQSLPYLYYLIMKGDNQDIGSFNLLRDAGAKPIRFDDKTIKVKFKPSVLNGVIGEDTQGGNPQLTAWAESRTSPWLATSYLPASESTVWSPSFVPHKGLIYGVQQDASTVTKYYEVTVTVHFEFKKPSVQSPSPFAPSVHKELIDKDEPVPVT